MRSWNLRPGDPLSLTIACDARLEKTDYCNDQVWELRLGEGDPPALALQTTFGLRARSMRLFPRFIEGDEAVIDPGEFVQPPSLSQIFPNFLSLWLSPFAQIEVAMEYWVPESHAICGRFFITNHDQVERHIKLEWIGQLNPTEGQRMAPVEKNGGLVLSGFSTKIYAVLAMTGGLRPGAGIYPAVQISIDLAPGEERAYNWALACLADENQSLALARALLTRRWDAERSRLEMLNAGQVEIYTGLPEWDAAFMLAQKQALSLFVGPTEALPFPSCVVARQPDLGFSLRGDGSDYNHLWNGQTPQDVTYLSSLVLPAAPQLAIGLLRNYLAVQAENGFIDWKPGLGGQRSGLLATPLLASLAWRIYSATEDREFLLDVFPGLLKFFQVWMSSAYDKDQDGFPEWQHPLQASAEDHPLYSPWHPESFGVDIASTESPQLAAMLYSECQALQRIARLVDQEQQAQTLQKFAVQLKEAVQSTWNSDRSAYLDRDRDAHSCTPIELLAQRQGSGIWLLQRNFDPPVRLLVHVRSETTAPRCRPLIFIHGKGVTGRHRVERIYDQQFKWSDNLGRVTGGNLYSTVERIEVYNLHAQDQVSVYRAGYDGLYQGNLLPLWAGIPDEEQARRLVEDTLTDPARFWKLFGIPTSGSADLDSQEGRNIYLPYNQLIGEGLVQYGYRAEAAELVRRLMNVIIQALQQDGAFRGNYHATSGKASGERGALYGLAPVSLFLETLGVRLISTKRVALAGSNPFPWPVTVKYRGLTVLRQKEKCVVIFPDGQTVHVDGAQAQVIALETIAEREEAPGSDAD